MSEAAESCVFCKIVAGVIPAWRVFEDEHSMAFLDINPLAPGHLLVIPRRHERFLWDLDAASAAGLASCLPLLTRAVMKATGAAGCNVLQSNGRVSGQLIEHVHFHIVPRREGDGLGFRWPARSYAAGEAEAMQHKILNALT